MARPMPRVLPVTRAVRWLDKRSSSGARCGSPGEYHGAPAPGRVPGGTGGLRKRAGRSWGRAVPARTGRGRRGPYTGVAMNPLTPAPTLARIASVGTALPPHYADQETLIATLRTWWSDRGRQAERIEALHRNVQVRGRHLALPLEEYARLDGFAAANDAWIRVGLDVGAAAIEKALARAGLVPRDV